MEDVEAGAPVLDKLEMEADTSSPVAPPPPELAQTETMDTQNDGKTINSHSIS